MSGIVSGNIIQTMRANIVNNYNDGDTRSVIKELSDHCALDALHDSNERYDPPKCHPETRTGVLQDIIDWIYGITYMLWLYGSAGIGKSAIAQSTAEELESQNRLAAAFFFSRTAAGSRRDHEECFIFTIAFQLMETIPELKPFIVDAITRTPSIWRRSLTNQVKVLILAPLMLFRKEHAPQDERYPWVIIVDGLDECREEGHERVLEALRMLCDGSSFKVVLTSRPEYKIKSWMSEFTSSEGEVKRSNIYPFDLNSVLGDGDVRLVFQEATAQIKKSHVIRRLIPVDWPSESVVNRVVRKASGHFIYVSTLLKYIEAPRHRDPPHIRLERALESDARIATRDRPFAALDNLYLFVLRNAEERDAIHELLALDIVWSDLDIYYLTESIICKLCSVTSLDVTFLDVASIIKYAVSSEDNCIPYNAYHASFYDFLKDPIRSEEFCVDLPHWEVHFCLKALELLHENLSKQENGKEINTLYSLAMLLSIKHLADPNVTSKFDDLCNLSDTSIDFFVKHPPNWFSSSAKFDRQLEAHIPHSYIEETPLFCFYDIDYQQCQFFHPSAYRLLQRRIMPLLHSHLQVCSQILPPELIPLIAVHGPDIIDTFKFNNLHDADVFNPLHNYGWSWLLFCCHYYRVPGSPIFSPKDFTAAVLFLLKHFQCRIDPHDPNYFLSNIFHPLVRSTLCPELAPLLPDAITFIEEKFVTIPSHWADARSMLNTLVAYVEIYKKLSYLYKASGETDNSQTLPGNLTQQDLYEMRFGELAERDGLGGSYEPWILAEGGIRGFNERKAKAKHKSECTFCGVQNSVEPSI